MKTSDEPLVLVRYMTDDCRHVMSDSFEKGVHLSSSTRDYGETHIAVSKIMFTYLILMVHGFLLKYL